MSEKKSKEREMMELAVKVMKDSVGEHREDGKVVPYVGAVLMWPDGKTDAASRGELRDGNHAEFTLLERKNANQRVEDCVLYATLEPCAPGSRTPPKRGCSEHIVDARIKEVWVGIEDPDPMVAGKGIEHLEKHGIKVRMFDRDLQDEITESNKEFLAGAIKRADEKKRNPEAEMQVRRAFEAVPPHVDMTDIDEVALAEYANLPGIHESPDSPTFKRILLQQGVLVQSANKEISPSGFGLLLFGKTPRRVYQQAGLLAKAFLPDGSESREIFDGPMIRIPKLAAEWLDKILPNTIDRSKMQRQNIPSHPTDAVREAVINGLIHRDYGMKEEKCQLVVTPDTIVVMSPGAPHPTISLEQIQSLDAPMVSRNPLLHYVFAQMELAEESGFGMDSFRSLPKKFGLPLPKIVMNGPYLEVTIFRSTKSAVVSLPKAVLEQLSKKEQAGWEYLSSLTEFERKDYEQHLGLTVKTAQRHIAKFIDLGLVEQEGGGRGSKYYVRRSDRDKERDKLS